MIRALTCLVLSAIAAPAFAAVLEFEARIETEDVPSERRAKAVDDVIRILLHRIDEIGAKNPRVERTGPDRIRVYLPRLDDDPAAIRSLLLRPAKFTFNRVIWSGTPSEARNQPLPQGGSVATQDIAGQPARAFVLAKADIVGGIADAVPTSDQFGPKIDLQLDAAATRAFAKLTADSIGQQVAMVLDGMILSAPVVREEITGGRLQITGQFEKREAERLALLIRSGSLPTRLVDLSAAASAAVTSGAAAVIPERMRHEARIALLIGNAKYAAVPTLANPVNDARDMAAALKKAGFVTAVVENANREKMMEAIDRFGRNIEAGGIALFFYAGHAVQVKGVNYLLPVDAALRSETEAAYRAVDAGFVLAQFESGNARVNVMLLDSCRDNPLPARTRSTGSTRGLAVVDRAPGGTVIAYATGPGETAADGDDRNGLFTSEFLKVVPESGMKFEDAFKKVISGVRQRSLGKQIPWITGSLEGDFYLTLPR